jgi:hypothetical protein
MVQNLAWAAGYNVVALPVAAGVLTPLGLTLPLQVGALLMSASTVIVALNAQLRRRIDLSPDGDSAAVTSSRRSRSPESPAGGTEGASAEPHGVP